LGLEDDQSWLSSKTPKLSVEIKKRAKDEEPDQPDDERP
jgi:hypothetical protein